MVVVLVADWWAIQQAFFQPEIAADLFPKIITVGVKNTLIYTTSRSSGDCCIALPIALLRLSSVKPCPDGSPPPTSSCCAACRRS